MTAAEQRAEREAETIRAINGHPPRDPPAMRMTDRRPLADTTRRRPLSVAPVDIDEPADDKPEANRQAWLSDVRYSQGVALEAVGQALGEEVDGARKAFEDALAYLEARHAADLGGLQKEITALRVEIAEVRGAQAERARGGIIRP
jgi:hypothetical protein